MSETEASTTTQPAPPPQSAPPSQPAPLSQPTPPAPPPETKPAEKKPTFKASYAFVIIDYLVRWLLYGLWRYEYLPGWIFWPAQTLVVPFFVILLAASRLSFVKSKYGYRPEENPDIEHTLSIWFLTISGIITGTYITYTLYPGWPTWVRLLLALMVFFVYGFYIAILAAGSSRAKPKEDEYSDIDLPIDQWVDENDREILRLETDKISVSQRVDTYTLESTLFGALSFSGFVTIIASEKAVLTGVQELLADLWEIARMVSAFDFTGYERPLSGMAKEEALLAAIAVETLICAMFFLSVVVSRLRFNDALKRVDLAVRLAMTYNQKEEDVYNLTLQAQDEAKAAAVSERLEVLKVKISNAVYHAEEAFKDLKPIVNYMWASRNMGLVSFLAILVTGAVWVSPVLAVIFAGLSVLAYVYARVEHWVRTNSLRRRGVINFFSRKAIFRHGRHARVDTP